MTSNLNPHSQMEDFDIQWLGDVPEHWSVRRLRNVANVLFSNVDKHSKDDEISVRICNYSDVYHNERIHSGMSFMRATASAEEIEKFRLNPGDVLITKDSESWDDIGVPALVQNSASDVICGYHLALLRPISGIMTGSFLHRAFTCPGVATQLFVRANGVTRFGLSQNAIKSCLLPVPLPTEQTAIVCFLDQANLQIERYIRAKEKLISLLEEQKQVMIHDAVMGRIDVRTGKPYPEYRPSDAEWLGDMPAHWEMGRLSSLMANVVDQSRLEAIGGVFLAMEHIESWTGKLQHSERVFAPDGWSKRFQAGDILFGKLRPYLAKVARPETAGCCVGEFLVLRSRHENYQGAYAEHFLRSKLVIDTINSSTYGARMPRAEWTFIGNLRVVCPPPPEQTAIACFLDEATANANRAIAHAKREIELLREYRTCLIADIVTGKLDVREAANELPELDSGPDDGDAEQFGPNQGHNHPKSACGRRQRK